MLLNIHSIILKARIKRNFFVKVLQVYRAAESYQLTYQSQYYYYHRLFTYILACFSNVSVICCGFLVMLQLVNTHMDDSDLEMIKKML